jgi:hypothetical protein
MLCFVQTADCNFNERSWGMIEVKKTWTASALLAAFLLAGCAPVTISSEPSGASVYYKESNELIGATPLTVNLIANNKEMMVRKSGYFSKSLILSPIDPDHVRVDLDRCDRILLLSEPDRVELHVEGVGLIGRTPYRLDYDKPYRTFQVKAPGYATQSFTIPDDPEDHVLINMERDDLVTVVSKPGNAEVFDASGNLLGSTPLAIDAAYKKAYELRKEGYYSTEFSVDENSASPMVVKLEREPIIIVYSAPEGALVVHRGVTLGQTPYRQLVNEDMEIEIKAERYYPKTITIAPDSPKQVSIELVPKPFVTINSEPAGGQLYRSGGVELLGTTPVEILIEKDTALEVHKPGYDIKAFMLSPESNTEVTVPLAQSIGVYEKTVVIDSAPSGAMVYRPGGAELIGKTPLEQRLRGERTLELHMEGFETKIVAVTPDSADNVVFALARDESARNVTISDPLLNTPSFF